jgi:predicted AAA+ superfamily ATPase
MEMLVPRPRLLDTVRSRLEHAPVVALLGPRQCGKSTAARQLQARHYFDLENPQDLTQLDQPLLALESLRGLVVIDEVQRKPDIFSLLRYLVDQYPDQRYLILGSASRDLIQQSSESLAGRISYIDMSGFSLEEIGVEAHQTLWFRGTFPRSYLAPSDAVSFQWRQDFITTFLERDIPQLGIRIPAATLRRFWEMLSHFHGQIVNFSELSTSFGMSDKTVRAYVDILAGTYMVTVLQPWFANTRKRVVRRPKLYISDTGIAHALFNVSNRKGLLSHPKLGASWEGFVLHQVLQLSTKLREHFYFWRTHAGAELDLLWHSNGKTYGVECKYADAPKITPSMRSALSDLALDHLWVVYPGTKRFRLSDTITVLPMVEYQTIREVLK